MAQGQRHNRFSLRPACQKDASFILRGFICLCCNLDDLVGLTTPCRWRLLPLPSLEVPAPIAGWLAQWQSAADGSVPTALTGNGTWGGRAAGHRSLPLSPPLLALPYKVPSRLSLRPSFGLSAGAYSSRLDRVCVGIWSDCTSAIDIATGRGGQHSDDALTINCRAATHILQAIGEPERICVRHTRSHVGDPGNEIADALAKRTCKGKGAIDCASISEVAAAARCPHFAWLWLLVEATRRPQAWPTFEHQGLWDSRPPLAPLPDPAQFASFFGWSPTTTAPPDNPVSVCLQRSS